MIRAFHPRKSAFYTLFVLFAVLFFEGDITSVFPAALLILAVHGFESFYRADINKIYGKNHYKPQEKLSLFRISLLLAILSIVSSFYFELPPWYVALPILAILGTSLSQSYQFVSDFVVSLVFPLIIIIHSGDLVTLAPVYWFVFFQELSIRSTYQLSRPFGMENYNLPKILGPEAALEFITVLGVLSVLWPILMARYAPGLAFFVFCSSAMVLTTSIYALRVSHIDRAQTIMQTASALFLAGLFMTLI
ncbi:MAG: hypothetical protein GOV01_01340 [Candidatus Altiarchaeota archaeon]|nr:hypothetical protein [Candidatus Altiarchaeota archaeon]